VLLLTAVPAVTGVTAAAAGSDQISDLQAQAAQIAQTLVREQLQVGSFQQQYSVASAQVTKDAAAVGQTQQQMNADQQRIDLDTGRVRTQALRDYMGAGSVTTGVEAQIFTSGVRIDLARSEYESIALGNVTTAIDELNTSRQHLQQHEALLQQQQAADQAEQVKQAGYLNQANATQSQLASEQAQVTGQLASAVAQQQAAQAAAAAAAVKASEAQAAQKSASATASTAPAATQAAAPTSTSAAVPAGGGGGAGATSDPPLPPFLQCVRQAESGGDYGAVSPDGQYMGAFQFSQSTWDLAAQDAGLPGLVGVPPNTASKADQDTLAVTLYNLDGEQPWYDPCRSA
jgi:peptidoglycan hydrolase CwlO-like protein